MGAPVCAFLQALPQCVVGVRTRAQESPQDREGCGASEGEIRGKRFFTHFLVLMSSFSLTVLPVSSSSSKGL